MRAGGLRPVQPGVHLIPIQHSRCDLSQGIDLEVQGVFPVFPGGTGKARFPPSALRTCSVNGPWFEVIAICWPEGSPPAARVPSGDQDRAVGGFNPSRLNRPWRR